MKFLERSPLHPILLAIYPVLALLAHNIDQIQASAAVRAALVSLIIGLALFLTLRVLVRDWSRAAILASFGLLLFFTYGHVYEQLKVLGLFSLARHRLLLPPSFLGFGIAAWFLARRGDRLEALTAGLNLVAIVALAMPLLQLTSFDLRARNAFRAREHSGIGLSQLQVPEGETPPDIYYIILDAYARGDVLREVYGFDNRHFLSRLTDLGFYVADCSQSNYAQSELSLASSLNMNYLPALGDKFEAGSADRSGLWPLLRHGEVRRALEELGYATVAFETGYYWTHWDNADVYLAPPRPTTLDQWFVAGGLNGFEAMMLETSAARLLTDSLQALALPERLGIDLDQPRSAHRDRILFVLEQLKFHRTPSIQGPKLVFAHLVIPHPPFVFGAKGEFVRGLQDSDPEAYVDQVEFINANMLAILEDLIVQSANPPVIILQADHGMRMRPDERMAILNAYYLPEVPDPGLYSAISPVNSFRVVFNTYLGAQYPLLEDESNFSNYDDPYTFEVVPNSRPACERE